MSYDSDTGIETLLGIVYGIAYIVLCIAFPYASILILIFFAWCFIDDWYQCTRYSKNTGKLRSEYFDGSLSTQHKIVVKLLKKFNL